MTFAEALHGKWIFRIALVSLLVFIAIVVLLSVDLTLTVFDKNQLRVIDYEWLAACVGIYFFTWLNIRRNSHSISAVID